MRIGIDAVSLGGGGGLTFMRGILRGFTTIDREHEYVLLAGRANAGRLQEGWSGKSTLRTIICHARGWMGRGYWEQAVLPGILRRERIDVLYASANHGPIFSRSPFVVVIQNVDPLVGVPGEMPLPFRLKMRALRLVMRASVRKARRVITVSDYTRGLVAEELRCPPEKLAVIPHGAPEDGRGPARELGRKLPTDQRYFLAVSNIKHNKNYEMLAEAFALASRSLQEPVELVIAGGIEHEGYYRRFQDIARCHGLSSRIRWLGTVDHNEMKDLYRGAIALIFPSRIESFGLPPLEAMAYGVPVIASRIQPVVEVCGEAVLYCAPDRAVEAAEAMVRVATDAGLRKDLVERGLRRASHFTWEEAARQTLAVLQAAASASPCAR